MTAYLEAKNERESTVEIPPGVYQGTVNANTKQQAGYIFCGQSTSNIYADGLTLYNTYQEYRNIIEEYEQPFNDFTGQSLIALFDNYKAAIPETFQKQPWEDILAFVSEVAFTRLMMKWGVKPSVILGDKLGLITASHIAGVMDFANGLRLIMLHHPDNNENVGNNPLVEIHLQSPNIPIVNPYTGCIFDSELLEPLFWTRYINKPRQYKKSIRTMMEHGAKIILALGVDVQDIHRRIKKSTSKELVWLSLKYEHQENTHNILEVLSTLYIHGVEIDWDSFYRHNKKHYHKLNLPTYPFQHRTYWFEAVEIPGKSTASAIQHQVPDTPQRFPSLPQFDRQTFVQTSTAEQEQQMKDTMRQIIAHLLKCSIETVDLNLSYHELGISSLQHVQLILILQDYLEMPVLVTNLYQDTTVNQSVSRLVSMITEFEQRTSLINYRDQPDAVIAKKTAPLDSATSQLTPFSLETTDHPDRETPDYVFLLSAPRAGSTLLRVMLDKHPKLYAPPELNLLMFDTMSEYVTALSPIGWADNLMRTIMRVKQIDLPQAEDLINNWVIENKPTNEVYKEIKVSIEKTLVDKSPIYSYNLPTMQRIPSYNNVSIIYLSRHPYSSITSMIQSKLVAKYVVTLGLGQKWDIYKQAEQQWSMLNRNILDFCEQLESRKWIRIRYEDLVTKPQKEMQRVCRFLNIRFDETVLYPYEGDHDTTPLPGRRATGGDHNFNKYTDIDASKGVEWRHLILPHTLGGIARSVATELGYTLPREQAAGFTTLKRGGLLSKRTGRRHRIQQKIYARHKKYDHPKKNLSGVIVRLLRMILRKVGSSISYQQGLRVITYTARSKIIQRVYIQHLTPAWQVLNIVTKNKLTNALKDSWTANYINYMLDWVQLKRPIFIHNPNLFSTDGLENLENALAVGNGVIIVGHHCQPLRLWNDFAKHNIQALGVSQTQIIGGLRVLLPESSRMDQGRSQAEQEILIQQLENCFKTLNREGVVYIDADATYGTGEKIKLPCLGRQVRFMTGFAEIALQTESPVIPLTAVYTNSGQVHLQYHPQLTVPPADIADEERIRGLVRQYVTLIESQWRKHPENIPLHICRMQLS
jgi:lauroyl/myristoyl acyltransferase/acyl carrier protein